MIDPTICPHCGAGSRRECDLEDEIGYCPAEEMDHDFEGDPKRDTGDEDD